MELKLKDTFNRRFLEEVNIYDLHPSFNFVSAGKWCKRFLAC